MVLLGASLFGVSILANSTSNYLSKRFWPQKPDKSEDGISLATIRQSSLQPEAKGSLKRNDSEFSLGLNRTESFDNIVDTLGPLCIFPLCDTGEAIWGAGEYVAKIIIGLVLVRTAFQASGRAIPQNWKIW